MAIEFIRLKLYYFLFYLGQGALFPYLSLYYKSALNLSNVQIGILGAFNPISITLLNPYILARAERLNCRRKYLIFFPIVASCVMILFPSFGILNRPSDRVFILVFCLMAIFAALHTQIFALLDSNVLKQLAEANKIKLPPVMPEDPVELENYRKQRRARINESTILYGKQRFVASLAYGGAAFSMGQILAAVQDTLPGSPEDALFAFKTPHYYTICHWIYAFFVAFGLVNVVIWPSQKKWYQKGLLVVYNFFGLSTDRFELALHKPIEEEEPKWIRDSYGNLEPILPAKALSFPQVVSLLIRHKSPHNTGNIVIFWIACFMMGTANCINDSFSFLIFVDKVKATNNVLGIAAICRVALEIPCFFLAKEISQFSTRFISWYRYPKYENLPGLARIQGFKWLSVIALFLFLFRLVMYVLIIKFQLTMWTIPFVELLNGVIFSQFSSCAIQFATCGAPPKYSNTSYSIMNAFMYGLGPIIGSIVGGAIYEAFGATILYLTAIGLVACAILLSLINIFVFGSTSTAAKYAVHP